MPPPPRRWRHWRAVRATRWGRWHGLPRHAGLAPCTATPARQPGCPANRNPFGGRCASLGGDDAMGTQRHPGGGGRAHGGQGYGSARAAARSASSYPPLQHEQKKPVYQDFGFTETVRNSRLRPNCEVWRQTFQCEMLGRLSGQKASTRTTPPNRWAKKVVTVSYSVGSAGRRIYAGCAEVGHAGSVR